MALLSWNVQQLPRSIPVLTAVASSLIFATENLLLHKVWNEQNFRNRWGRRVNGNVVCIKNTRNGIYSFEVDSERHIHIFSPSKFLLEFCLSSGRQMNMKCVWIKWYEILCGSNLIGPWSNYQKKKRVLFCEISCIN